jgi:LmbE family N-acetylglucosaminyl deacetylase
MTRTHGLLAAAALLLATGLGNAATLQRSRTLVVLLAHADDESAAAPVLARYAREGVSVYMIIASDGAAGSGNQGTLTRPDSGPTGSALATARAEEGSCAASSLGAKDPILLGFPDGKRAGAPGMPERLFYMYLPPEVFRAVNPQRGVPPLVFPQAKYFTMHVPFMPADFDAAAKAMACHHSQFTAETLRRMVPEFRRVWNGTIGFIPSSLAMSGADLFR